MGSIARTGNSSSENHSTWIKRAIVDRPTGRRALAATSGPWVRKSRWGGLTDRPIAVTGEDDETGAAMEPAYRSPGRTRNHRSVVI